MFKFLTRWFAGNAPASVPQPPPETALSIAARLIREFEGFRPMPYQDSANVWTIGIGTIRLGGVPVTADTRPITMAQALDAMQAELVPTAARVDALVLVPLSNAQRAAIYSFVYNEGVGAFGNSTLLRRVNAGDTAGAYACFADWNKAHVNGVLTEIRGLTIRRAREAAIFQGAAV